MKSNKIVDALRCRASGGQSVCGDCNYFVPEISDPDCGNCRLIRILTDAANEIEKLAKERDYFKTECERAIGKFNTDALFYAEPKQDNVNHPGHYNFGKIEVIEYIRDKLTPEEYQGGCTMNVLKYVSRWRHKNGLEDLKKAKVYLDWLIESVEKEGNRNHGKQD